MQILGRTSKTSLGNYFARLLWLLIGAAIATILYQYKPWLSYTAVLIFLLYLIADILQARGRSMGEWELWVVQHGHRFAIYVNRIGFIFGVCVGLVTRNLLYAALTYAAAGWLVGFCFDIFIREALEEKRVRVDPSEAKAYMQSTAN